MSDLFGLRHMTQANLAGYCSNFSLYYVAMDIIAKEEWTFGCSYRFYFAISISAL